MTHRLGPAASARRAAAVLLAAAMLVATAACPSGAGGADEVKTLVAKQVEAINGRDMQALARIWSQQDDILLFDVAPPGRFKGWPEIARSFNTLFEKAGELHMTVENLEVREAGGTLATATYDWALSGKVGETPLEDRGQATEIYRHEKDGWKLMHAHYSAVPPGGAAAASAATDAGAAAEKPADRKGAAPAAPSKPSAAQPPAPKSPAAKSPAARAPGAKPSGAAHGR
jgi:ketosteroid isomerase-like protein